MCNLHTHTHTHKYALHISLYNKGSFDRKRLNHLHSIKLKIQTE